MFGAYFAVFRQKNNSCNEKEISIEENES